MLQVSVNSGQALELLLETHKLFSLLLSTIKMQGLAQLKMKLYSAESAVAASNGNNHLPMECTHPQSNSVDDSNTPHKENYLQPQLCPTDQHRGTGGVTTTCIDCCDPYVVSGWCRLVNNLLQTFPDLIGSYVHNYCVVSSLIR